jgi:hypothetical protein
VYTKAEWDSVADDIREPAKFCASYYRGCGPAGGHKYLYFPKNQPEVVIPSIHGPEYGYHHYHIDWLRRNEAFNCDHFWFKSLQDIRTKADKNLNPHYSEVASMPLHHPYHRFFSLFLDTTARDMFDYLSKKPNRFEAMVTVSS